MYPLRFAPVFRRYLWGGHRLRDVLGKPTGDESAAESWEVVDHGEDQSVVSDGEFRGRSLAALIDTHAAEMFGLALAKRLTAGTIPEHLRSRFPLLVKILDANRDLSIQVHPDDTMGATLTPPDLGKTEAWYVMHADPGAKIYAGLRDGVGQQEFKEAIADGTTDTVMHAFEPQAGDCVMVPAGTLHAIGAGLLVAEIQQASDTTFRVYDWGRVDSDGRPRDLHIESAIQATDFARGPVHPIRRPSNDGVTELVACDNFVIRRHKITSPIAIGGDDRFRIVIVTEGAATVQGDPAAPRWAVVKRCCYRRRWDRRKFRRRMSTSSFWKCSCHSRTVVPTVSGNIRWGPSIDNLKPAELPSFVSAVIAAGRAGRYIRWGPSIDNLKPAELPSFVSADIAAGRAGR